MPKRVALEDVIDGLDMQTDDVTAYLDRDTGTVVMVGDEIAYLSERDERDTLADWERELVAVRREVEQGSKRYVQLPDREDVHEWDIVRRFCDSVGDDQVKELLLRAIQGRGAFPPVQETSSIAAACVIAGSTSSATRYAR